MLALALVLVGADLVLRDGNRIVRQSVFVQPGVARSFRAGTVLPGERAVLVVSGQGLLEPGLVGVWHTTAWLDAPGATRIDRRTVPRTRANATFDLGDPAHPRRVFADAC